MGSYGEKICHLEPFFILPIIPDLQKCNKASIYAAFSVFDQNSQKITKYHKTLYIVVVDLYKHDIKYF